MDSLSVISIGPTSTDFDVKARKQLGLYLLLLLCKSKFIRAYTHSATLSSYTILHGFEVQNQYIYITCKFRPWPYKESGLCLVGLSVGQLGLQHTGRSERRLVNLLTKLHAAIGQNCRETIITVSAQHYILHKKQFKNKRWNTTLKLRYQVNSNRGLFGVCSRCC